ncbi:DegT/DnrJ/EryC1/StrS family aminotransferase [Flavisolibacter ginsenosidimutans]|uniref:DegT/DnrJ/EryC1/StrS family aminotransferase n=1 Tax=Flavisolibacter ginsenosidimutans TaxID=661481 RepID=A0A5B8UFF8_9BACT|nr:DegT/DnrJ/EryC1/StrS family aminotransferase [Flavisolibacter ginsenosidimutans]QEC54869.1 DegT/DnrJ/EryC1/StrS family aminotransferase [Flavisolibacter ginsenosidimutans]
MINVNKPFLPPIEEYNAYVESIWKRNWLTNNGPLVNELELKLKEYLNVEHLLFLNNGTIALQIAVKALNLSGEIITTPFSFVATTSSIVWEGCQPVFADIDPHTLNIDPASIEKAITDKTSAILATHVYGNPCDIDAISAIARKHKLKVIYDAAHCFGTLYKGKSVFAYGDVSTTSFHATKLFHTIEGGAVFTQDPDLLKKMAYIRNFGFDGPDNFAELGINGKNSEFHAAMGLANLKYADEILKQRKASCKYYDERLVNLKHTKIRLQEEGGFNYAYYPIILESESMLLKCMEELNDNRIFPRRYFYPSLSSLKYVQNAEMPVCDSIAKRVLCLPLYHDLDKFDIDFICRILLRSQKYQFLNSLLG